MRIVLYLMLLVSAGCCLVYGDRLWLAWQDGNLPLWAPLLGPVTFTAFVLVYAIDRGLLVSRHNYRLGRAFFQLGFALVFLTVLWQHAYDRLRLGHVLGLPEHEARAATGAPTPQPLARRLLAHSEPAVRTAVCAALQDLALQGPLSRDLQVPLAAAALDTNAEVRSACAAAAAAAAAALQANLALP